MFYIFAFIGMICWGISPLFAKMGLDKVSPLVGLSVRTFFTASIMLFWMGISGNITQLKNVSMTTGTLLVIEAVLATLIGDLAYFAALKEGSASIVMLIMACSPVVTILCSMIFFSERLTLVNIIGACFVTIGLFLII